MAERRIADPATMRERGRKWYAANRDARRAILRDYYAKRFFWARGMKLRGNARANARELAGLWKAQRGLCALTGRRLDRSAQLDHITPRARGGADEISNLRWLCAEANLARRALTDAEFVGLCADVIHWIGSRIAHVAHLQGPPHDRV